VKILFVHQNFPGQYIHLVRALAAEGGHTLVALGIEPLSEPIPAGVHHFRYSLSRGTSSDVHPLASETEAKVIRGEACASAAYELRQQGFCPDVICVHPGWGEALFLSDVWPGIPIICYQEFYYHPRALDTDFDPELQGEAGWLACAKVRMKNAYLLLTLETSRWNVTPTAFQRSTFPAGWQDRISIVHDGIDTALAAPHADPPPLSLADGTVLRHGDPIVTFVNRRLEPYRGCHTFLRSIPELQRRCPDARIVVVGGTEGVSYGRACPDGQWKDRFLAEIEGHYDPSRVHFTGTLPYKQFLPLLRLSACHVYLTYPFVLSWSLLEAMSIGCSVVGSATAPVQEVIRDGENGLLVDFFRPNDLAVAVAELLQHRARAAALGAAARNTVLRDYSLAACLPRQRGLLELVAAGVIGA